MQFKDLVNRALEIRKKYEQLEKQNYGREWNNEEIALGFVGDMGDLVKLVQGKEGVRPVEDLDQKLAHELSDCLWSVIVLSAKYGVDLESEFTKTMDQLDKRIEKG